MLQWALDRLPAGDGFAMQSYPIGICRDGKLAAVAVYTAWRGCNIEMAIAADTPRWATRQVVALLMAYAFLELGVRRITATPARRNKRSRRFVEGIGGRLEGVMRDGLPDDDVLIYGLTREQWARSKWAAGMVPEARKAA